MGVCDPAGNGHYNTIHRFFYEYGETTSIFFYSVNYEKRIQYVDLFKKEKNEVLN